MVAEAREGRRAEGFWRRFPTFYVAAGPFRWLFGSRRRVLTLLGLLLVAVAAPAAWWPLQLAGLPDVGDPFDVKAFLAETVPDDRNAYVPFRRAAERFKPIVGKDTSAVGAGGFAADWPTAPPEVRAWLEANRGALAVFREGTERPDAHDPSHLATLSQGSDWDAVPLFIRLSLLEASRLSGLGDMDGARVWYRAALRAVYHYGRRARVYRRMDAQRWHNDINVRMLLWAADPRTTPEQILRAVDDVNGCAALAASEAYTVKAEYVFTDPSFDRPDHPVYGPPPRWVVPLGYLASFGAGGSPLTSDQIRALSTAWRAWRREPERERRVFRLVTANRLAFEALPPARRPNPDPYPVRCDLYPLGPDAPAAARALAPGDLGRWIDSCLDAPVLLPMSVGNRLQGFDVVNRHTLLDILNSELDRRDPQAAPPP